MFWQSIDYSGAVGRMTNILNCTQFNWCFLISFFCSVNCSTRFCFMAKHCTILIINNDCNFFLNVPLLTTVYLPMSHATLLKIEVPSLLMAHHIHVLLFSKVLIFEASVGCMSACNNYIPVCETVGCTDWWMECVYTNQVFIINLKYVSICDD